MTASQQVRLDLLYYSLLLCLALLCFYGGVVVLYSIGSEVMPKQNSSIQYKMQFSTSTSVLVYEAEKLKFHPGSAPKLTKKEKEENQRKKKGKQKLSIPRVFVFHPIWRILPCPTQYAFMIDTLPGKTFLQKMKSLNEYGSSCKTKKYDLFPNYKPDPKLLENIRTLKKEAKEYILKNQALRWKLKRFITIWRLKRFRCVNDSDFVTLNPIENPIPVYYFNTQCKYIFDGKSLSQLIHKRLLNHDGQIPDPLFPMNPYTNEKFTLAQLVSILKNCKQQGCSSWAIENFSKARFSMDRFLLYSRKSLRMHAVKSILHNYADWDGFDLLLNFIETHHDEHGANFSKHLYAFCLREMPREPKIESWRNLCQEYYELEILAEDDAQRDLAFAKVKGRTGPLCAPPHDLAAKRSFFLSMKKNGSSTNSSSGV